MKDKSSSLRSSQEIDRSPLDVSSSDGTSFSRLSKKWRHAKTRHSPRHPVALNSVCVCARAKFSTYLRTEIPSGRDRVALECRFIRGVTDIPVRLGGGFQLGLISTALVQGHVVQVLVASRLNNWLVLKYRTGVQARNKNRCRAVFRAYLRRVCVTAGNSSRVSFILILRPHQSKNRAARQRSWKYNRVDHTNNFVDRNINGTKMVCLYFLRSFQIKKFKFDLATNRFHYGVPSRPCGERYFE